MTEDEMYEVLDWIELKRMKVMRVIPIASRDPWTLHKEENVCVGCISIFAKEYMNDIPSVMRLEEDWRDRGADWLHSDGKD